MAEPPFCGHKPGLECEMWSPCAPQGEEIMDAYVTVWADAGHFHFVSSSNDGHPIVHDPVEHTTGNSYQPFIRTWSPFSEAGFYRLCFRLKSLDPSAPYRCTEGVIGVDGKAVGFGPDRDSFNIFPEP